MAATLEGNDLSHIDDWLDHYKPQSGGEVRAKEWLEHFRRPAVDKDRKWLAENPLFCTYADGKRYRCIGASRLGDIWLTSHFERENGYDLRILVTHCTDWSDKP